MELCSNFDADEIRRLGKRFRKLDLDNSGSLSIDEFMSLPELQQNPLVQRVIDIFDADGNGEVDFKEFIQGVSQFSVKGDKESKLRFAFRIYDMDNDGYISNGELFQKLAWSLKGHEEPTLTTVHLFPYMETYGVTVSASDCETSCETWTLTLREEQRLRVFENKVLRKIFGAKRDEVTGEWRKLHNAELHALYSSSDIIRNIKSRRLRWAGHVARMGESRNAYRMLVGRPEGIRPLGRPRRRWEDNIKMDLREVGNDGRDWINLAQDRVQWRAYVRAAMNLWVP
ncbi:hypothetical protein ANN_24675 [Periplaneta americana]|uniref:EF-hand domain-containing protein n=1 Tax=Periplaneta americana TaxID=6978 RepID=A0ABQ8S467_PERAM|nr:hypothetical protein ANN_24675 [Periplaneta americana]